MEFFEVGKIYKRTEIHEKFKGQQYGGISTPAEHNIILLFTGDAGEQYGYSDGWSESGMFFYTGEGQTGNMIFKGGNTAIRDHVANDKELHLFQYVRVGYVKYIGKMIYVKFHYKILPDQDNNQRRAIVFELKPFQSE